MQTHNAENERTKRRYFIFLKEALGQSEPTVDGVAKALARFETYTHRRDFKSFRLEQAVAFKAHLASQLAQHSRKPLSKATLSSTLTSLKRFFRWLAGQPGYRSRLQHDHAEYFHPSEKDMRVATARREKSGPTIEQVKRVIQMMPTRTVIERRDQALVAFAILTGARDGAIASTKLKHLNLPEGYLEQDAREMKTKFSKSFRTYFFPVGDEIRDIVIDWVRFLREQLLWGDDDPLFPAPQMTLNATRQFEVNGLAREHWRNATRIRTIFRKAFERAGLPYFNPHSFRNTLVRLGQSKCKGPEDLKAWSQNIGHDHVMTTLACYGHVETARQGEILRRLGSGTLEDEDQGGLMKELRALRLSIETRLGAPEHENPPPATSSQERRTDEGGKN